MPLYKICYKFFDEVSSEHIDAVNYYYHKNIESQDDVENLEDVVREYAENYFCGAIGDLKILSFSKFE